MELLTTGDFMYALKCESWQHRINTSYLFKQVVVSFLYKPSTLFTIMPLPMHKLILLKN